MAVFWMVAVVLLTAGGMLRLGRRMLAAPAALLTLASLRPPSADHTRG
jgi:hypothetical protein